MEFDFDKSYGDYVIVTAQDVENAEKEAQKIVCQQAESIVPKEYHNQIEYFSKPMDGFIVTVDEDNYAQLGCDENEIGLKITVPDYLTICWKYTPKKTNDMCTQPFPDCKLVGKIEYIKAICDEYRDGVQTNVTMSNSLQRIISIFYPPLQKRSV